MENNKFNIIFATDWFKKDDLLIQPKDLYMKIYNSWLFNKQINWFLELLGFNISYDIKVLSEPERQGEGYMYTVKAENYVYCWLNYRLFTKKVENGKFI